MANQLRASKRRASMFKKLPSGMFFPLSLSSNEFRQISVIPVLAAMLRLTIERVVCGDTGRRG